MGTDKINKVKDAIEWANKRVALKDLSQGFTPLQWEYLEFAFQDFVHKSAVDIKGADEIKKVSETLAVVISYGTFKDGQWVFGYWKGTNEKKVFRYSSKIDYSTYYEGRLYPVLYTIGTETLEGIPSSPEPVKEGELLLDVKKLANDIQQFYFKGESSGHNEKMLIEMINKAIQSKEDGREVEFAVWVAHSKYEAQYATEPIWADKEENRISSSELFQIFLKQNAKP